MKNLSKKSLGFIALLMTVKLFAADSLHYTGRLVQPNGAPMTGNRNLTFDLVKGSDPANPICTIEKTGVPLQNGVFNVELPFGTVPPSLSPCDIGGFSSFSDAIGALITADEDLYIQVTDMAVGSPYPKQLITTPPISMFARKVALNSIVQTNLKGITVDCPAGKFIGTSASGSFTCLDISSGSGTVATSQIADGAVTTVKLADSSVTTAKIVDGTILVTDLNASGTCTSGKYLTLGSSGTFICADLPAGGVGTANIADGAITTVKLADLAVSTAKIQDSAVTNLKLADGAVSTNKVIDSAITNAKLADGSVSTAKLQDDSVTGAKIADNSITTSHIVNGTIISSDLNVSGTCSAGKYLTLGAAGAFVCADLPTGGVGTSELADGSVTNVKLADNSVSTSKLQDGSVTNVKLADNSVSTVKIQDGSINSAKIADLSIATADIANNAITSAKIDSSTVQVRVSGTCAAGSAVSSVAANGTVGCQTVGSAFTGTGSAGVITKFTGGTSIGNSIMSEVGSTITVSGTITASTQMNSPAYYYTSDKNLKKNVKTYSHALKTMENLRGVRFDWKENNKKDIGFIAQEVEKVEPHLVTTSENGIKSVKYGNIVAIVIEAVKELKEKLMSQDENLKREIATVKKENKELKERLEAQEARLNRQEEMMKKLVESGKK